MTRASRSSAFASSSAFGTRAKKRKIIRNAVRHLERVFSESAAAADAEASAPDHDVAVLGAAARSNATPPPDGASEETPCKRQRTSRGPTGGSAISMPDLGRSDNASATGTPARDGHKNSPSFGDSIYSLGANTDSAVSIVAQRRSVYSHAARAEEARLLRGTETLVSPVTRKVYDFLKARRARRKDYLPTVLNAKTRKWNGEYSLLDALRRQARADKLGTRSSSSTKAFSTTLE